MHTDIKSGGRVMRLIPPVFRPYALLMRLDRPIGTWLLLLPGWWALMMAAGGAARLNLHDLKLFVLFGIGSVIMRGAGCVINDLWDRRFDAQVERTRGRPLPSGALSVKQSFIFLMILLALGFLILCQMSLVTILLGFLTLPLIVSYPLMKRITWWPQAVLGLTFNFGALMGWSAAALTLQLPALLLYAAGIFWTLGYDTIYAHQDKEDDARIGIKSSALKLGAASKRWVAGFYGIAFVFLAESFIAAHTGWLSLAALALAAAHLVRQVRRWDMDDPASSLSVFKSNRDFGFLVLLAAAIQV